MANETAKFPRTKAFEEVSRADLIELINFVSSITLKILYAYFSLVISVSVSLFYRQKGYISHLVH